MTAPLRPGDRVLIAATVAHVPNKLSAHAGLVQVRFTSGDVGDSLVPASAVRRDPGPKFIPGMMVAPVDADDHRFWFVKEADGAVVFCPPAGPNQFPHQIPARADLRVLWSPEYDEADTR